MNNTEQELIIKIYKVLNKDNNTLMPGIEVFSTHIIDPLWVSGLMYLILDRSISSVKESKQNEFLNNTLFYLDNMIKNDDTGNYLDKIKINDEQY